MANAKGMITATAAIVRCPASVARRSQPLQNTAKDDLFHYRRLNRCLERQEYPFPPLDVSGQLDKWMPFRMIQRNERVKAEYERSRDDEGGDAKAEIGRPARPRQTDLAWPASGAHMEHAEEKAEGRCQGQWAGNIDVT